MSNAKNSRPDEQIPGGPSHTDPDNQGSGKVAEARNSSGEQPATQTHQGRRSPESRGDRDSHVGSGNQTQSRQGNAGSTSGGGGRGAG